MAQYTAVGGVVRDLTHFGAESPTVKLARARPG
jgi:hypothetical protein